MRKSRFARRLYGAMFAVLMLSACSESLDRTPEPILDAWAQRWNASVEELIGEVAAAYGEKLPSKVDPKIEAALLEDMRQVFLEELSWEAMGKAAVEERLREICGINLLNGLSPYFSGELSREDMPEQMKSDSTSCAIEIDLFVSARSAYAMHELASRELPSLFRRHGIDPKRM